MKLAILCLLVVFVRADYGEEEKMELASFCIKNCTPPVVHEFFQSIIFAITKRIPGHCSKEACVDKNRFLSLAKCVEEKAWPLLQCSKRLVDLAQVALQDHPHNQKINYTCSIVVETTQCIEEILQECGSQPFSLVKEIAGDVIKLGIKAYCHKSFRNDFFLDDTERTSTTNVFQERKKSYTEIPTVSGPTPFPQFVKGYRPGIASMSQTVSLACLASTLALSGLYLYRYR